MKCSKSVTEIM